MWLLGNLPEIIRKTQPLAYQEWERQVCVQAGPWGPPGVCSGRVHGSARCVCRRAMGASGMCMWGLGSSIFVRAGPCEQHIQYALAHCGRLHLKQRKTLHWADALLALSSSAG